MKNPAVFLGVIVMAAALGCGGAKLQSRFPENNQGQLDAVLAKIAAAGSPDQAGAKPFLSVVLEGGNGLMIVDLNTGTSLWERKDITVSSAPTVGGGAVFLRSEDKIVALSASTGETLWKKPIKESYLYGFAVDGATVAVTMGNTDGGSPATGRMGQVLAMDVMSGNKKWNVSGEKMFGAPAAMGGLVFVPWDRQAISIFDAESGSEVCRLLRKDSTVDFVLAGTGGVYYGSGRDIQKLAKESWTGLKDEKTTFEFEVKDMPGTPRIYPDAYVNSTYEGGAQARNRLVWSIDKTRDKVGLDQDMIYLVFYRYVIGFDAAKKQPLWVHMSEMKVAASHAAADGVLLLGYDGTLTYIDGLTGTSKQMWKAPVTALNAFFQTAGFAAPALEKSEPNLHRGLVDMILDVDTQVLPLRKYGMKLLATIPDETVIMDLVQVMGSGSLPKPLRDEAARLLRTMKGGVHFLFDALKQHYDFLDETGAPPSGAIASSLAESKETKAAPMLVEHLVDHETPADELVELTAAILELGDAKAYEPLRSFFMMYHADSCMSQHVDVMLNVARGLLKFGGDEGKQIVEQVAADPKSPESLRVQLTEMLKKGPGEEGGSAEKPAGKAPDEKAGGTGESDVEEEKE
jgi:outer membrane protein assembly factor BamB